MFYDIAAVVVMGVLAILARRLLADGRRLQPTPVYLFLFFGKSVRRAWLKYEARRVATHHYRSVKSDVELMGTHLSDVDRELLALRMSSTITRWSYRNFFARRIWNIFAAYLITFTSLIVLERPNNEVSSELWKESQWLYFSIGACVLLVAVLVRMTAMRIGLYSDFWIETGPPPVLILAGIFGVLFRATYSLLWIHDRRLNSDQMAVYWVAIIEMIFLTLGALVASTTLSVLRYRGAMEPLDAMAMRVFGIAHRLYRIEHKRLWTHAGTVSNVIGEIERAARSAERAVLLRAVRWDPSFNADVRSYSAKLGSAIRAHKAQLAKASGPKEVAKVRQALIGGLVDWALRDRGP
ncbi:hypothetical protein ACFQ9X_17015 [Catenulispora yoronensis]